MSPPDERAPPRRPGVARRLLVGSLAALAWTVVASVAVAASALYHVGTPTGREVIRSEGERAVSDLVRGRLSIGHLPPLSMSRVAVDHVSVFDPAGRRVLHVRRIEVVPDVDALLGGEIRVRRVGLRGVRLFLADDGSGSPSIARAFEPVSPRPDEEPSGPPPVVVVVAVELDDLAARSDLPDARGLGVDAVTLRASLVLGAAVQARIERLDARVTRGGRAIGELSARATIDSRAVTDASVRLGLGAARVDAAASWVADPGILWARADLADVTPATLAAAGLPIEALSPALSVAGTVWVEGPPDSLHAAADLRTSAGDVAAQASLRPGPIVIASLSSPALALERIATSAPELALRGDVRSELRPTGDALELEVEIDDAEVGPHVVPSLLASATLGPDEVRLHDVRLPYLPGHVHASGRYAYEGHAAAHLDVDVREVRREPNLRALIPRASGSVRARLDAEVELTEPMRLDVRGEVVARRARLGDVRVGSLELRGRASGDPARPVVDVSASGTDLALGGPALSRARLRARGGPERYSVSASTRLATGEHVEADLVARIARGTYTVDGTVDALGLLPRPLRVELTRVRIDPDRRIELERVRARSGSMSAVAAGVYSFRRPSALRVEVEDLELSSLDELMGAAAPEVSGRVSATAELGGTPRRPRADVRLEYGGGALAGLPVAGATVDAHLDASAGALSAHADLSLGPGGHVTVEARGSLPADAPIDRALRHGDYGATVTLDAVDLGIARALAPDRAIPVAGHVDGRVELGGSLERPQVEAALDVAGLRYDGSAPVEIAIRAVHDGERAATEIVARDGDRELARVTGALSLDLAALARAPEGADRLLEDREWELAVRVPRQRLDRLPAPWGERVGAPVTLEANARYAGSPGEPIAGRLDAHASVDSSAVDGECGASVGSNLRVHGASANRRTEISVEALSGSRRTIALDARIPTPLRRWLRDGFPEDLPPGEVDLTVSGLSIADVPVACAYATGTLSGRGRARGLFTATPQIEVDLAADDLDVRGSGPLRLSLDSRADARTWTLNAALAAGETGGMRVAAEAPITWGEGGVRPALRAREPLAAQVTFEDAPIAPLLAPVPGVRRVRGRLDGSVEAAGPLEDLDVSGEVALAGVSVSLVESGQRLDDLEGRLRFTNRRVVLEGFSARDRNGRLRGDGEVELADGWRPTAATVDAEARQFPVRRDGAIAARLTTRIAVRADLDRDLPEVVVTLTEMAVALPEETPGQVQPLEPHPEIVFDDDPEPVVARAPTDDAEEDEGSAASLLRTVIDATQPFWVRRPDFAIQLAARLILLLDEDGTRISGEVEVRRGFFELLGKRFEVEMGQITFDGGAEVNPIVRIVATHRLQGSDDTVSAIIAGRLDRPELSFASTVPGVETAGDVLQLLTRRRSGASRGDEETAQGQAASLLSGLAAGILTVTARRELGGLIPVIAVETGDQIGSARVRAGFDANALIPKFLEEVIVGAYIEGFVGAGEEQQSGGGGPEGRRAAGGFLIELLFPRGFVGTGRFEPPSNWSLDMTWEP